MERRPFASELFVQAGTALYGGEWQSALARELGLSLRTVQRIARAAARGCGYPISETIMDALADRVRGRERELKDAWMNIKRGFCA